MSAALRVRNNVLFPSRKKWTYEEQGPGHLPQNIVTTAIIALVLGVPCTVLGVTHLIANSSNKLELNKNGVSSTPAAVTASSTEVAIIREPFETTGDLHSYSNESKKSDSISAYAALKNTTAHQCQFPAVLPGETCFLKLRGKQRVFKFVENSKRTGTMESVACSKYGCQNDTVTFCDTGCKVSFSDLLTDAELSWGKRAFGN